MEINFSVKRESNNEVQYFENFDEAQKAFIQLVDEYSKTSSEDKITLCEFVKSYSFKGFKPMMSFDKYYGNN